MRSRREGAEDASLNSETREGTGGGPPPPQTPTRTFQR